MSTPLYDEGVNDDIKGEPYPPHQFVPPLPGAQGGCAYGWLDRPCTLDRDARLHGIDLVDTEGRLVVRGTETTVILELLFREARDLATVKDKAYGKAWQRQGYMGNVARVMSKAERLRELMWRDDAYGPGGRDENTPEEETVQDTLLDLINLSAMTLHNLRAGNRWGNRE